MQSNLLLGLPSEDRPQAAAEVTRRIGRSPIPLQTSTATIQSRLLTWMTVAIALIVSPAVLAADPTVTGLLGLAQYSRSGGAYTPLRVGMTLQAGDVVQTATGSALDLDLGGVARTVRLLQSTTVGLTSVVPGQTLLDLKSGELLGKPDRHTTGQKFKVEVPGGVAGIVEGQFRLSARGYLVVLEGTAVFVDSTVVGEPPVYTLNGTVYYSPQEHAVRPTPKELEREIRTQVKAKVPKK